MSAPKTPRLSPFMERMISFLLPYFLGMTPDFSEARAEVLETIAAYGTRTRAEMLQAVQIIALGFTTLEILAEAHVATDMSPNMRLRFRGCANSLNRSGQQNEKTLAKRLACDVPAATNPETDPLNDVDDAAVEASIEHARAAIEKYRGSMSGAHPDTAPHGNPDPSQQPWGMEMSAHLREMGLNGRSTSPG